MSSAASSSNYPTRPLGGSAKHIQVGQVAFGCMGMTWVDPSKFTPDVQAFETIKAAVDSGSNFLNSGAFYGPSSDPYANLKLLKRFYDAHPDYKSKTVLSVKGGMNVEGYSEKGMAGLAPDASVKHLEHDLQQIRKMLGTDQGGKEIDVYEMARRDTKVSIEETMYNMLSLSSQTYTDQDGKEKKGKGLFHHISLSEVGLETIQKATAVAPIACIEIEVSAFERTAFDLGIVEYCSKAQIPILAYSPVGKGLLSGQLKSINDIPEGDPRRHMDRLNAENFEKNLELANHFTRLAQSHSPPITPAQLALSWLIHSSPNPSPGQAVIIPLPGTTKAERAKENAGAATVNLDDKTKNEIDQVIKDFKVAGGRYNEAARNHSALWG